MFQHLAAEVLDASEPAAASSLHVNTVTYMYYRDLKMGRASHSTLKNEANKQFTKLPTVL